MKLKQLLGGALAAVLVVTSIPTAGLVVSADEGDVGAQHGIEDTGYVYYRLTSDNSWRVSTDAGNAAESAIGNILKDDDMWTSAQSVETTATEKTEKPVIDTTLAVRNKIYMKLSTKQDVGKLVYWSPKNNRNGKVLKAKISVANSDDDINFAESDKALETLGGLTWTKVAGDETARDKGDEPSASNGNYTPAAYVYKFDEVQQTQYVCFEALETSVQYGQQLPNRLISCNELELYQQCNNEEPDASSTGKIALTAQQVLADFKFHENSIGNLVDGNRGDAGGGAGVANSIEYSDVTNENYLDVPEQKGFVENNNIYIDLSEAKDLGMLTYVAGQLDGSICDANIYLSNAETRPTEVSDVDADASNAQTEADAKWVKVYTGEQLWARWNANPRSNNGHSVYWKPLKAKHVRIEVEHTYGEKYGTGQTFDRNRRINVKRILLYEAVKAVDVSRQATEQGGIPETKIVAFSGYLDEAAKTNNSVTNMFDSKSGEEKGHNHDTTWKPGPAKTDTTNVPYIVLDLGEGTRTIIDGYSILWDTQNYASKYVVLTADKLDTDEIQTVEPSQTNNWSDKVLKNPPKLNGQGRDFTNLTYDTAVWSEVRSKTVTVGGENATATSSADGVMDSESFDGVSPDNQYFKTTTSEEVKRYICLVMLDVNGDAAAPEIKCAEILGAKRNVTPLTNVELNVVPPVSGAKPVAISRKPTDNGYTVVNVTWSSVAADGTETQIYPPTSGSGSTFGNPDEITYKVSATLKPDSAKIFTKDSVVTLKENKEDNTGKTYKVVTALQKDDTIEIEYTFAKCTCALGDITGIEDTITFTLNNNQQQTSDPLAATAQLTGDCQAEGHADADVEISYAITSGGDYVEVIDDGGSKKLRTKGVGRATLQVTASANGKTKTKDVTIIITAPASADSKAELSEMADEADDVKAGLVEEEYTPESWQDLLDAIDEARAVAAKGDATQAEVDEAKTALQEAIDGLEQDPELTQALEDLETALADAEEAINAPENKDRADAAFKAVQNAYNAAKAAKEAGNKNKAELQSLVSALEDALATLDETPLPDPEVAQAQKALDDAVNGAKAAYDEGVKAGRTDAAWNAFKAAYEAAMNPPADADKAKLQSLLTALQAAKNALGTGGGTPQQNPNQNQNQNQNQGANLPAVNSQHTVGKLVYQVKTSTATDKTVMVVKATSKTQKKITIPATVTIGGQAYKVVEIKANAFAKNKKLTTVKIGANVVKIGKKAFFNCAKLKTVNIKAKGLKTIGKQAFAKINKKATIKVPKKQKNALKKKLKKAKTIKSAKIK